jgi:hypothetical protein
MLAKLNFNTKFNKKKLITFLRLKILVIKVN